MRGALQAAVVLPFVRNLSWDVAEVRALREALGRQPWRKLVDALA